MPKHVTISLLDGYKTTAADLADPATTAAGFITVSLGDTVDTNKEQVTGPLMVAAVNVRRAIEEGLAAPADVTLYGVKSNVATQASLTLIATDNVGITLGAGVLPKSNSTQFRERVEDAVNALTEGLV